MHFGMDHASPYEAGLAQRVAAAYARPTWTGRYLEQISGTSTALTAEEAARIHADGLSILLCYNGAQPGDTPGLYATGAANGQVAARHARAIGAPDGCAIAVDVETTWYLSNSFAAGWMDAVHAGGYLPALYLNAQNGQHAASYIAARAASTAPRALIWSSEPEFNADRAIIPAAWYDFGQTWLGAHGGDVAYWQYAENVVGGAVDVDLASDAGWAALWHPQAPTPVLTGRLAVSQACGLKSRPAHGGPNLATIPAGGQVVATEQRATDALGTVWALVAWRSTSGWIPAAYLVPVGG